MRFFRIRRDGPDVPHEVERVPEPDLREWKVYYQLIDDEVPGTVHVKEFGRGESALDNSWDFFQYTKKARSGMYNGRRVSVWPSGHEQ